MKNDLKKVRKVLLAITTIFNFGSGYAQYCATAPSNCSLDDEIQSVNFAGINNASGCSNGGYTDYTATTAASVTVGNTYDFTVTTGPGGREAIGVWIDYDQNTVFDADEFIYAGSTAGGLVKTSITIPADAAAGKTRMRVRNFYVQGSSVLETIFITTPNASCASVGTGYGESEDYTIIIAAGTDCMGRPSVGAAMASVTDACMGAAFTLTASVTPLAAGLSYQWQVSVDRGVSWTNLGTAQTYAVYNMPGQVVASQYRVTVTCTASGLSTTSTTVSVGQNTIADCYCINAINFDCTAGDLITNVSFGSFKRDSTCADSGTGYSNFTGLGAVELTAGVATSVSVIVGPSSNGWLYESVGAWIDYNQNGVFEETEYTYIGTGLDTTVVGNVTVPTTALSGNTRMRVVVGAVMADEFDTTYACGPKTEDNPFGEMEDYLVNITDRLATKLFRSAQASLYPNPTSSMVNIELNNTDILQSVTVYTIAGQQVLSQHYTTQADDYTLDMQQLPTGIYMLKLNGASGIYTHKLIRN